MNLKELPQSLFFLTVCLVAGVFLAGCSRIPIEGEAASAGKVANVLNGILDKSHLTEGESAAAQLSSLVDKDKLNQSLTDLNQIMSRIPTNQQKSLAFLSLEKKAKEEYDGAVSLAMTAGESEDETKIANKKSKLEEKIKDQEKAVEEERIKVENEKEIDSSAKEELLEELNGLLERLKPLQGRLDQAGDSATLLKLEEELLSLAVYGAHLGKIEGLSIIYQINFVSDNEVTELLLSGDEFVKRALEQDLSVSDKEVALGNARQAAVKIKNNNQLVEQLFKTIVPLADATLYESYYNESWDKMGVVNQDLGALRDALAAFAG